MDPLFTRRHNGSLDPILKLRNIGILFYLKKDDIVGIIIFFCLL